MYQCGMCQKEERHVPNQVDLMVWCNRLDLLALSNFKGEIQIHRLNWQKVWNLPPPKENVTVQAMTWRPDGKALAIGYSTGSVYIVDIEDKDVLNKYELEIENSEEFEVTKQHGITCITWAVRSETLDSATEYNFYDDPTIFLQKPPSLNNEYKNQASDESIKDFKEMQDPSQLSLLMVGYGTGHIYLSIFGRYPYGTIHMAQVAKDECGEFKVLDIVLSDDFSMMQVIYIDVATKNVFTALINTSVLSAFAEEMYIVAKRHGHIIQLVSYLDQTMVSITEAWEHILLEMDTKMSYYAASVPEGGVSADLLELLMLGVPSDELELFLLQELTAKGLKKFGSSVELSYSTIQKLVLKQLNVVGQNLTFHLAELRGLTRVPDRFKSLGIDEGTVTEAIKACCAFLNKCLELQQVIDISMRNYKSFFRWLFVVIVRLLDEQTPSEIVKITQQELTHIAEFLYNFNNAQVENADNKTEKPKFNLERLGQYLQDQELSILPDDEDNPWHKFLKENACLLKENDSIYSMTEFKKFSLVQQHKYLKSAIEKVFNVAEKDMGKHFSVLYNIRYFECDNFDTLKVSQLFDASQQKFTVALSNNGDCIHFISINIKEKSCTATAMKYHFTSNILKDTKEPNCVDKLPVYDLQFYSTEYLSVLIQDPFVKENTIFIQVPLKIAVDHTEEINIKSKSFIFNEKQTAKDISLYLEQGIYKVLDKMDGSQIAVSGSRQVAVVLTKSRRKVRVYLLGVNENEDEDETLNTTPRSHTTNRSDTSQRTPDQHNVTTDDVTF